MIDVAEIDQDDDGEVTRWDGSPHREKASPGKSGPYLTEQARDALVGHIAMLQARLERYEPGGWRHHHTGKVIQPPATVVIGASEDPALRARLAVLDAKLASVQSELRTAEDAIREHIRQKMVLRRQLEEAHAGRGGRAAGAEVREPKPVPAAAERPTVRQVAAAPAGARPAAVVEPSGAAVAADGGAVERPLVAPPAPVEAPADAPLIPGKNRPRSKEGWFYHALKRLGGERTIAEVCAADQRGIKGGNCAAIQSEQKGFIERCARTGLANRYRIKA